MSDDPKQQQPIDKTKIIGFRVTEEELHNTIYPIMHDSAIISLISLTMIYPDIVPGRFCMQFWMGHYRMKKKKQQFDMSQQEIEEEKKKLAAIVAEKEAWEKWDNSTPRVIEKTVKQIEQTEKDLDRESAAAASFSQTNHISSKAAAAKTKGAGIVITTSKSLSLEDMMA